MNLADIDKSEFVLLAKAIEPALYKNHIPLGSDDTSDPPSDEELDSVFGEPSDLSDGTDAFHAMLEDTNNTKMYSVYTDGSDWYYSLLTKAV